MIPTVKSWKYGSEKAVTAAFTATSLRPCGGTFWRRVQHADTLT
jgi:hypothetical protein